MAESYSLQATIAQLSKGRRSPIARSLLSQLSVGIGFLTDFWREQYSPSLSRTGGSAIKFVTAGRAAARAIRSSSCAPTPAAKGT